MQGAIAVMHCLKEQGVDTVFGYPGGMILPLYDAFYDSDEIREILVTHEQDAAHAADGYARASGKVGVCIATSGPGATNLVTGLATAFMDSIPVVAITGQVDTSLLGSDSFQETDILDVTMPITKHNYKVKEPEKLIPTIREAFELARSGRPGPVLIDVPRNVFLSEVDYKAKKPKKHVPSKPDADFLICAAEAADEIAKAQKPVVIIGGGVISSGSSKEVLAFIEKYNLPVAYTLMGLGGIPRSHKNCLGFSGMHGEKTANRAIAKADLVIAMGSRFADRQTGSIQKYTQGTKFIHIDIDPAEIDKNVSGVLGLAGDMKTILSLLMKHEAGADLSKWWAEIRGWQETTAFDYHSSKFSVPCVLHHIAEATKGKPFAFTTDVGQHQMWAALHLSIEKPRTWLTSGGLGTMGYGVPSAMGAQVYYGKKRRVITIVGDGGVKMTGNELYTISRLSLPVITIIVNNKSLGMIRQLQRVNYKKRYIACELDYPMDYVKYAESFGVKGEAVSSQEEFCDAFSRALADDKHPRVIVLEVARTFVEPMIKGGARIDEFVDFK